MTVIPAAYQHWEQGGHGPKMPKVVLSKCNFFTHYHTVVIYYSLEMFSSSKDVATVNFVALFTVVTAIDYSRK